MQISLFTFISISFIIILQKRQLSFEKEQNEVYIINIIMYISLLTILSLSLSFSSIPLQLIQYLQSILRGHTVRDEFLTHTKRNTETNELAKTVQNILSGHYVRRTLLQQNER